jgi:ABC-2 family transporter protein
MIWLTWRQFRAQAGAVYAAIAAFAVVLAITGSRLLELKRTGANVFDQLTATDRNLYVAGLVVVALAPAVIGAFWGAPMVARELEAGTHRLVWNQSITRTRWLATKLGLTTLAAAAAVGALTLAVTWWAEPLDGVASNTHGSLPSRLTPVAFAMRGVVPVGYAVFALALGACAGVLLRRTVPAMAVALAVFALVQINVPQWIRPHLVPPASQTIPITGPHFDGIMSGPDGTTRLTLNTGNRGDWILSNETLDASGRVISTLPAWVEECLPGPPRAAAERAEASPLGACLARLDDLGYRQRLVYQPADRFWTLQWVETALFFALSGLLTWLCFWWTRRKLA